MSNLPYLSSGALALSLVLCSVLYSCSEEGRGRQDIAVSGGSSTAADEPSVAGVMEELRKKEEEKEKSLQGQGGIPSPAPNGQVIDPQSPEPTPETPEIYTTLFRGFGPDGDTFGIVGSGLQSSIAQFKVIQGPGSGRSQLHVCVSRADGSPFVDTDPNCRGHLQREALQAWLRKSELRFGAPERAVILCQFPATAESGGASEVFEIFQLESRCQDAGGQVTELLGFTPL